MSASWTCLRDSPILQDRVTNPGILGVIRARDHRVTWGEMFARCDAPPEPASTKRSPLASGSVGEHLLRGAVGLIAAALAIVLVAVIGPVSLALLLVTAVVWRGCPTCWTVGLLGTLADDRARRGCSRC
ncbi:MAG: hypothetical protein ACLP01_09965 [Solirubrobacteraceae bacterium]